ncbi:helix-turn-helix domain-containing protein [Kibdelosporangium persicum]|uniref:Transcriptional regulator n=1 Tax=Kibdelosporangium persicum TaxID=2698649 RepID=A0ABX2F0P3_9PSEU|nr:helix-turn-helix transcriptional regulator [Kibdelosporangium persicum]NRN64483.1 Transcriptional regulator [Kibdelosporangium persicum]
MAQRREGLAARRAVLGYSQEALATEVGVDFTTVGRWERGTLTPAPSRRPALAKVLRVSLDELDTLLTPANTPAHAGKAFSTRREVMIDAAKATGAAMTTRMFNDEHAIASSRLAAPNALVVRVHQDYQAARYSEVARALPWAVGSVDSLIEECSGTRQREAYRLRYSLAIAQAKLANKIGDTEAAVQAAVTARSAAESAGAEFGHAAAAYQESCSLLNAGELHEADELSMSAADRIDPREPQGLSWRGALVLLSAIIAARRGDSAESGRRLDHAEELARRLGADANIGWTAFGPTNVLIHRLSAAVALDDPHTARTFVDRIDVTAMPAGLHGRQARYHLDSAWAHACRGEDLQAVIHLLETERVAHELVRTNPNARALIGEMLGRERRGAVPGLRALALRTGVIV